jgi:hypothetical protein
VFPWLLVQAKAASAVVCLGLFVLQEQYLLYLANFVVDGAIALFVWWLCLRAERNEVARDLQPTEGRLGGQTRGELRGR